MVSEMMTQFSWNKARLQKSPMESELLTPREIAGAILLKDRRFLVWGYVEQNGEIQVDYYFNKALVGKKAGRYYASRGSWYSTPYKSLKEVRKEVESYTKVSLMGGVIEKSELGGFVDKEQKSTENDHIINHGDNFDNVQWVRGADVHVKQEVGENYDRRATEEAEIIPLGSSSGVIEFESGIYCVWQIDRETGQIKADCYHEKELLGKESGRFLAERGNLVCNPKDGLYKIRKQIKQYFQDTYEGFSKAS